MPPNFTVTDSRGQVVSSTSERRTPLRRIVGAITVLVLALLAVVTESAAGGANTAIQQAAYYAQGAMYAVVAVGVALAVLWIVRPD